MALSKKKDVILTQRQISKLKEILRRSRSLTKAEKDDYTIAFNCAKTYEPLEKRAGRIVASLPTCGIQWEKILHFYLAKYSEGYVSLLLGIPESVLRSITSGSCVPSERLQSQMLAKYAKDRDISLVEAMNERN